MQMNHAFIYCGIFLLSLLYVPLEAQEYAHKFQDPTFSVEERTEDLISKLTLEEKVSQLMYDSPAIERLGIPQYNWWNECLHGVARAGSG